MKQGYDKKLVDEQLEKVDKLVRDNLLQEKDQEQQDPKRILLLLIPNLTPVVRENWNILKPTKIYGNYSKNSQSQPLRETVKKLNIPSRTGKCTPCLSGARTLCYNQVLTTNTFMSQQTKRTFNIFFNLNCKSEYVIYLMECILRKMQYVRKAKAVFNLRLNNYRKDTKKPNSILVCKHFQEQGHNFNKHAKFIIIDKLVNLHGSKEALREMLVIRKNFWIRKLKTLVPFGLSQERSI